MTVYDDAADLIPKLNRTQLASLEQLIWWRTEEIRKETDRRSRVDVSRGEFEDLVNLVNLVKQEQRT